MDFSLRQWLTLVLTVVVFIVAALIVRGTASDPGVEERPFDEVAWCQSANAVSTWRSVLDGSAAGDTGDDLLNLRTALNEAQSVAPPALRTDVARLYDFVLLTTQANRRSDGDLAAALRDAQGNTDQVRVQAAIANVDEAVVACGHRSLRG